MTYSCVIHYSTTNAVSTSGALDDHVSSIPHTPPRHEINSLSCVPFENRTCTQIHFINISPKLIIECVGYKRWRVVIQDLEIARTTTYRRNT